MDLDLEPKTADVSGVRPRTDAEFDVHVLMVAQTAHAALLADILRRDRCFSRAHVTGTDLVVGGGMVVW